MRSKLFRRPTHTTVVAYLALFAAVGTGGAYAANTIRSTDIVDGEVKSADIANQSITSSDVQDGSINTFDVAHIAGVDILDNDLTGTDIKANSIGANDIGSGQVASDEVANDSLLQSDIRAGAVTNDEVLDNSLKDEDIAKGTFVNFAAIIGSIPANSCIWKYISGVDAVDDHLLLTPRFFTAHPDVAFRVESSPTTQLAYLKACNNRAETVDAGTTAFNLLVIEAQ